MALLGLQRATDVELCAYALTSGYVLCSKDDDFHHLIAARGYEPKWVHLALGNAGNDAVLAALMSAADRIEAAFSDPAVGVVIVEKGGQRQ